MAATTLCAVFTGIRGVALCPMPSVVDPALPPLVPHFQAMTESPHLYLVTKLSLPHVGGLFTVAMARLNVRIRRRLFASLLRQEIGFFDSTKTGEITSRLSADTTTVADQVCLNLNVMLRSLTQATLVLVRTPHPPVLVMSQYVIPWESSSNCCGHY